VRGRELAEFVRELGLGLWGMAAQKDAARLLMSIMLKKKDFIPGDVGEIPGSGGVRVYIGSIGAALSKPILDRLGVTSVLCCAAGIIPPFPEAFEYKLIDVRDTPGHAVLLASHFEECAAWMRTKREGNILVHCFKGKSRSATLCAAHLMINCGMSLRLALLHLRTARGGRSIEPNIGFMLELRKLDIRLHGADSMIAGIEQGPE